MHKLGTRAKETEEACAALSFLTGHIGDKFVGDGEPTCACFAEHRFTTLGKLHKFGTLMMWVGNEINQAFGTQLVNDALHGLSHEPHVTRDACDRQCSRAFRDRAHHLPPRACQPQGCDDRVPKSDERPVQSKDCERQDGGVVRESDVCLRHTQT